ncbi:NADH dehydrogenase (ubiquinone) B14 subunit [Nomia melanderi]|uniref:NADH dehydrogenase (ubiquinone) B14 subunit n=1 Tax=Nomia melanderi TaxID=2448451 RepID=UPI003FCE7FF7
MATSLRPVVKKVKPILSLNQQDARRRALGLYKLFLRQIPQTLLEYDIPKTNEDCKKKIREEFMKHANITDLRVQDILISKGKMTFEEIFNVWMPQGRLMDYWRETVEPKPTDFMSKFLSGQD